MPQRLITVSELIERCAPPSEKHRALWLRRAREWSGAGILPTAKRQRQGSGRHRLYDFDTLYLAAVLFRISDLGIPIGVLGSISALIQPPHRTKERREFAEFWRQARDPTSDHVYLGVAPVPGETDAVSYEIGFSSIQFLDGAWAAINLTVTFQQLKI